MSDWTLRRVVRGFASRYVDASNSLYQRAHPDRPVGRALAVPFAAGARAVGSPVSIAVVCHAYYPDIFEELLPRLQHLPHGSDLFLSVAGPEERRAVLRATSGWKHGTVDVRIVANRGRDIAPKLVTFADVYSRPYDLVLFMHTKQTMDRSLGDSWRTALFDTLAGSDAVVESVLTLFDRDPELGMVIPQHHDSIASTAGWNGNFAPAERLARRMGLRVRSWERLEFPSGSMFWCRPAALTPLLKLGLTVEDFPDERGQRGITIAHAIERLFLRVCEAAGFGWVKISHPDHGMAGPGVVLVAAPPDLDAFTRTETIQLHEYGEFPARMRLHAMETAFSSAGRSAVSHARSFWSKLRSTGSTAA